MNIEDHYRAHGTLTSDQIEYLIVVHSVVQKARDAANPRGRIYSILSRSETPIYQAVERLRAYLMQLGTRTDASLPEGLIEQQEAVRDLDKIEHMIDHALKSEGESWLAFLRRLPDAPD